MNKDEVPKLIQVVPVTGWLVEFWRVDEPEMEYAATQPVLALGLTATGKIIGLIDGAGIDYAERQPCNIRYKMKA